ncbi:type II toxin-antitoxin system RelE/ParE family toxin [Pseudomonas sp. CAN2814]|uniref:type II toxin-antitoxin system RelE/ParE family toxin n=1 Tax=Pseudomonas sp. CAN1 TaxID=3046726 RepID=UPI002647FC38|nr:type II toxin-antitoxin system RelE/ParE family toxin [Pseudomonas sp. CAN1]MDN6855843.1 type II toxin-antitoxin system RelE/ParE family toxin [Pseudomonas sp. CAN1]
MIRSFRHKGLRALYQLGDPRGVRADHVPRLKRILAALESANGPRDMDLPGYRLHGLKGSLSGYWSVSVSGNWRVIFRFVDSDVELLDYLDYH